MTPGEADVELFLSRLRWEGECLVYTEPRFPLGYGRHPSGGGTVLAHRFAWELENGPIPAGVIVDHYVCHNPPCVRVAHLRAVTQALNMQNRKGPNKGNRSGVRGVTWSAAAKKWRVRVTHRRVEHHGGVFDDLEEAEAVAIQLRTRLFGAENAGKSRHNIERED